jgi:hypothetical protein
MVALGVSYERGNGFYENNSELGVIFYCILRLLMRRILQSAIKLSKSDLAMDQYL